MTVNLPQILLLLDTTVILNGSARVWQGYGPLGNCYLPQVVLDEVRFLCNRAPDPSQEKSAREFFRFYPNSGWRITAETMSHPALKSAQGQTLSKRARQIITIAECAYGASQHFPEQLVVLATDNQPLLKRAQTLQVINLCGVTGAALKQWSLSAKPPKAVNQAAIKMKTAGVRLATARSPVSSSRPANRTSPSTSHSATAPAKPRKPISAPSRRATPDIQSASSFYALSQLLSLVISLAGFVVVGFLIWRLAQPQRFEQFWRRHNLPKLPQLIGQSVGKVKPYTPPTLSATHPPIHPSTHLPSSTGTLFLP